MERYPALPTLPKTACEYIRTIANNPLLDEQECWEYLRAWALEAMKPETLKTKERA